MQEHHHRFKRRKPMFRFFATPEDKVFSILRKCGEKEREAIIKECVFQWLQKFHVHANPTKKHKNPKPLSNTELHRLFDTGGQCDG
jgi:hypothetical protein